MSQMITEEMLAFLKGQDFIRLGQSINKGNWQSVVMGCRRMQNRCKELGMNDFIKDLQRLQDAAMHRETTACKQILAGIVVKRVNLLKKAAEV